MIGAVDRFVSSAAAVVRPLQVVVLEESGQDVVEYGLLIGSIAVVVLLGVTSFGNQIAPWFQHLAARITTLGT